MGSSDLPSARTTGMCGAQMECEGKCAFAIVVTGETRKYGNVILKKGVIPIS